MDYPKSLQTECHATPSGPERSVSPVERQRRYDVGDGFRYAGVNPGEACEFQQAVRRNKQDESQNITFLKEDNFLWSVFLFRPSFACSRLTKFVFSKI